MTRHATTAPTALHVGAPDVAGPLAVFPVLGPPAALDVRAPLVAGDALDAAEHLARPPPSRRTSRRCRRSSAPR